jgi:hypothetical protein
MLPLTTADLLAHAIVASVLENLDMERLVREVGHAVAQRILGNNESVDEVARELHEKLLLRNESTKKVVIESIYKDSPESTHNVSVFLEAPSLAEARPLLKRVGGAHYLCLVVADSYLGHWNKIYRQIPSITPKLRSQLLLIPASHPANRHVIKIRVLQLLLFIAVCHRLSQLHHPAESRAGFPIVRCACECECVRDSCGVDALLIGREESCLWGYEERLR